MSAAIFDDAELLGLGTALVAQANADHEEVLCALTALGLANRAAYLMSYEDRSALERPDLTAPGLTPARCVFGEEPGSVRSWCKNLLYNCISQGGTDFAPANYAAQLYTWMEGLSHADPPEFDFDFDEDRFAEDRFAEDCQGPECRKDCP